jgi:hypothetical protein
LKRGNVARQQFPTINGNGNFSLERWVLGLVILPQLVTVVIVVDRLNFKKIVVLRLIGIKRNRE